MRAADDPVVIAYLDALDRALPAGRRARAAIRAELSDGLACAIAARVACGDDPQTAALAAVAEFGDPLVVSRAFARELAAESAHRIGLGLMVGGPLVGLLWVATSPGTGWAARIGATLSAVPVYSMFLLLVIPAAIVAARRANLLAAQVAAIGCAAGDAVLLSTALLGGHAERWAVLASTARLTAALLAGRRVARLRAAAG